MKGKILIFAACFVALVAVEADASVFSASSSRSLQGVFSEPGYSYIDVAEYQADLNFKLEGMMEFQLLNKPVGNLNFGVLEEKTNRLGSQYQSRSGSGSGTNTTVDMSGDRSGSGFFVSTPQSRRLLRRDYGYSYRGAGSGGGAQPLLSQDPLNSGLPGGDAIFVGDTATERDHESRDGRMTVHPAPEPATWVLLASGLVFLGVFVRNRRQQGDLL